MGKLEKFLMSPAASATGSLGSSILNQIFTKRNTERTLQANMKLADYQYSKDMEMWNKMNEYNAPSSQMDRYKAAGINPNLVAGSGGAGSATTMPRYQSPTASFNYKPPVDPMAMLSQYQDMAVRQANIDLLKSQKENVDARTATESLRPDQIAQLIRLSKQKYGYNYELFPMQKDLLSNKVGLQTVEALMRRQQLETEGWRASTERAKSYDSWDAYNARANSQFYKKKYNFETEMKPKQLERYGLQTQITTTQQLMDQWWYDYYSRFNAGSTRLFDKISEGLGTLTGFAGGLKGLVKKNSYSKTNNYY